MSPEIDAAIIAKLHEQENDNVFTTDASGVTTDENAPAELNDELVRENPLAFSPEGIAAGQLDEKLAARMSAFRAGVVWGALFWSEDDQDNPNLDNAFSLYLLSELMGAMGVSALDLD